MDDSRPAQFAKMDKLLVTYALLRKETKVAIIIKTNTPLGETEDFMDAYPKGANLNNQNVEVWKQKTKGQQEEWNDAVKGQQNMMAAILGHCDKATKAQVKAHLDFATIMNDRKNLDFIEVL